MDNVSSAGYAHADSRSTMAITFHPGEEITLTTFIDTDLNGRNVFDEAGQVQIEVEIGRLKSVPLTVTVSDPTEMEKTALNALRSSDLVRYLDMDPARYGYSDEKMQKLSHLAEAYSLSNYGEECAYAGTLLLIARGKPEDFKKAKDILNSLNARHPSPRALYYLGQIAERQGDRKMAISYWQTAADVKGNPYFSEKASAMHEDRLRPRKMLVTN